MKVSVAALAPPTPPETGASSVAMPRSAASSCALRALSTSMVEQSMNSAPWCAAGSTSFQTDKTCSPAGSMEMTMSAFSTQALRVGDDLHAVAGGGLRARPRTTSKPRTCSPDLTRLAAIGPPMLPRPMNPMFAMCGSLSA